MGGILWHTQGSGKTLTMVWLAKWILTHWAELNPRVLIVTDRDELDEQIEKTFTGVDENIVRTKSGKDLINRLNVYDDSLICSLVERSSISIISVVFPVSRRRATRFMHA